MLLLHSAQCCTKLTHSLQFLVAALAYRRTAIAAVLAEVVAVVAAASAMLALELLTARAHTAAACYQALLHTAHSKRIRMHSECHHFTAPSALKLPFEILLRHVITTAVILLFPPFRLCHREAAHAAAHHARQVAAARPSRRVTQ
jgi:hypothetical protein